MNVSNKNAADRYLDANRIGHPSLYGIGLWSDGVTVLNQQVRALNLAWALLEGEKIGCGVKDTVDRIHRLAIIGGGFAGLTFAAGLIKKDSHASITLFEKMDTLLPLQEGSDSRWLHPKIYDWPLPGSEASVAMMPVLNWSAGRASDVAVSAMRDWRTVSSVMRIKDCELQVICGASHIHVSPSARDSTLSIEYIGDKRANDGSILTNAKMTRVAGTEQFDTVVLATGFGIEQVSANSYWRNESIGQPHLGEARRTFLVSGYGDGAMIDLFRLTISQFRQDRTLGELLAEKGKLVEAISVVASEFKKQQTDLFHRFEAVQADATFGPLMNAAIQDLSKRIRRDTMVYLSFGRRDTRKVADLFEPRIARMSFQNRFLLYLLYRAGGLNPIHLSENDGAIDLKLASRTHSIPESNFILRHGTNRFQSLDSILSKPLKSDVKLKLQEKIETARKGGDNLCQLWTGGYFGFSGRAARAEFNNDDDDKRLWRKEYLPGPTKLLSAVLCSSIAGIVEGSLSGEVRVTLHRAMLFGAEEVLQQCCDYAGTSSINGAQSAGRTFLAGHGTIGQAYRTMKIIRSKKGATPGQLQIAMQRLGLNESSRQRASEVGFVLAIPIIEPTDCFTAPWPVVGVLYVDSRTRDFFIDDAMLSRIVKILSGFILSILERDQGADKVRNIRLNHIMNKSIEGVPLPADVVDVLEEVATVDPPKSTRPVHLNFDYAEFVSISDG